MALQGPGKLIRVETSRTIIYISQRVATDSQFPFRASDPLWIRIDKGGRRLTIEKASEVKGKKTE